MEFSGMTRARIAEAVTHVVRTPSSEDQCRSAARWRNRGVKFVAGQDVVEDGIRAAQLGAMQVLAEWMAANPGQTPDLEALLPE